MVRKKVINILFIMLFIIILGGKKVSASNIVSTDRIVESGNGNVTISITSSQPLGAYSLELIEDGGLELVELKAGTGSTANGKKISGASTTGLTELGSYIFKIPTVSSETVYKIKFRASGMEDINNTGLPDVENNATITVKVPSAEKPNTENPITSNDKVIKKGYVNTSTLRVRKEASQNSSVIASLKKDNEVSILEILNGWYKIKINNSIGYVAIKYISDAKSTDKTNTEPETPNTTTTDSDATLKNLGITPKEYDFSDFKKDTMQYSVEVPNDVTNVKIYAEATSSSAKITGTGKVDLKEGDNSFNVEVTAKDGTKKTYTIAIKRAVAQTTVDNNPDEEKNLRLSKLIISNFDLVPNFDKEIYEYKIDVDENISKLDLTAEANEKNAKIEILGNENFKEGENVITIILTNEETQEVTTYQIIVNKSTPQEIIGIAKWTNPSTWGLKEKVIVATGVALVLIIIVAIVLKIRLAKQDIDYDVELPGGEELDKALSKHQELVEDTEENKKHEIIEENTSFDDNPETPTYIKSTFKDDIFPEKKVDTNKEIYIDDSIPNDYTEQYTSNRKKGKHSL